MSSNKNNDGTTVAIAKAMNATKVWADIANYMSLAVATYLDRVMVYEDFMNHDMLDLLEDLEDKYDTVMRATSGESLRAVLKAKKQDLNI